MIEHFELFDALATRGERVDMGGGDQSVYLDIFRPALVTVMDENCHDAHHIKIGDHLCSAHLWCSQSALILTAFGTAPVRRPVEYYETSEGTPPPDFDGVTFAVFGPAIIVTPRDLGWMDDGRDGFYFIVCPYPGCFATARIFENLREGAPWPTPLAEMAPTLRRIIGLCALPKGD